MSEVQDSPDINQTRHPEATNGQSSTAPPAYTSPSPFQTTFGSVSLHMSDRIRFVQFPPQDLSAISATLRAHWPRGIQEERPYSVSHEFKLRGGPWSGSGTGPDAVPALILMRELFAALYALGWIMTASTDISRKTLDKDTLIFRKQPVPPPDAKWVAMSFKNGDKLRCLGAPPELVSALSNMLRSLRMLRAEEKKSTAANYHEFKLYGCPWQATGEDTMLTRLLILKLVEVLEVHGWSLYASIDQSSGGSKYGETDSWYCVRAVDWQPGSIIFHR